MRAADLRRADKCKKMGVGAVISIAISALSTGFTSAKIALDKDLDTQGRKNQPNFYGEFFRVLY